YGHTGCARRYLVPQVLDRHDDRAGRAAGHDRFFAHEPAATDHAFHVGQLDVAVNQIGLIEFRADGRAVAWDEPLGGLAAEDDAADGVHGDDLRVEFVLARVLGATADRAAGAGRAEQVVELTVEFRDDLAHRLVVRAQV